MTFVCCVDFHLVKFLSLPQTTPLHMATKNQHRDTEKYLVDHGADVNMKDGVGDQNCLYLLDSSASDVNDS